MAQCACSYRGEKPYSKMMCLQYAKGSSGSSQYFTASNFFILGLVLLSTSLFKLLYIEHASDFCVHLEDIFCKRKVLFEVTLVQILLSCLFNELTGTVSINSYFDMELEALTCLNWIICINFVHSTGYSRLENFMVL